MEAGNIGSIALERDHAPGKWSSPLTMLGKLGIPKRPGEKGTRLGAKKERQNKGKANGQGGGVWVG